MSTPSTDMYSFLRILALGLTLSAFLAPASGVHAEGKPAQELPGWLAGTWNGSGQQKSNGHTWSIRLVAKVDHGRASFKISYPSLKCGGHWTLVKDTDTQATFVEHITFGKHECVDGGSVTVGLSGANTLRYHWKGGNGDAASGKLTREQHN
jgi:hypothetical protein